MENTVSCAQFVFRTAQCKTSSTFSKKKKEAPTRRNKVALLTTLALLGETNSRVNPLVSFYTRVLTVTIQMATTSAVDPTFT